MQKPQITSKNRKTFITITCSAVGIAILTTAFFKPNYPLNEKTNLADELNMHPKITEPPKENDNAATLKTAQIRKRLQQKFKEQQHFQTTSSMDQKHPEKIQENLEKSNTLARNANQPQKALAHDDEENHSHLHDHAGQQSIIQALSPNVIDAVNRMTHQTEEGTQISVREDGTVTVDMGDTAFRAVPVATVDDKGIVTITEFFEPTSIEPLTHVNSIH